VDAGFATTVMGSLAAACLFVSPATSSGPWTGILLGLNVGLMLGTKGSGLPFATVVIAAVVAVSAVARRRHPADPVRVSCWPPLAAVLVALAVGGYWYVRNALVTGNPLYPFRLQFGQRVLAQGFDPQFLAGGTVEALAGYARWSWRFVAWLQPDAPIRGPYSAGGLGYIWLAGALPAIGYWWVRVIRDRARGPAWALGLVTGVVGVLYVIQPAAWEARYTLWLLALGLPCLGAAIGDAAARWRSRPGHLAVLAIGLALAAVAVWESHRTLTLEWSAHRSSRSPGGAGAFRDPADVHFPGLADAPGFKDFLASRTVARGRWSRRQHAGTFLGGVLAMPLGARQVLAVPALSQADLASPLGTASGRQEPSPEGIAQAQAAGATWFLWESDAPGDTPAALLPFTERYSYRVADDVSFELFRIGRASATPAPDGQDPTTP
jgi:hypothetical protein